MARACHDHRRRSSGVVIQTGPGGTGLRPQTDHPPLPGEGRPAVSGRMTEYLRDTGCNLQRDDRIEPDRSRRVCIAATTFHTLGDFTHPIDALIAAGRKP